MTATDVSTDLHARIDAVLDENPNAEHHDVAKWILNDLREADRLIDELLTLVADEVWRHKRTRARRKEHEAFGNKHEEESVEEPAEEDVLDDQSRSETHRGPVVEDTTFRLTPEVLAGRRMIVNETFAIPGTGRRVTWGEATIADHEKRIGWLEQFIRGNQRTADQHRTVVRELRAAECNTLNELLAIQEAA